MSAYNTVTIPWRDTSSKKILCIRIQFKYGELWQHEYMIGDSILWGESITEDSLKRKLKVVVEGILEGEKPSESIPENFEIFIYKNIIQRVIPSTNKYNFSKSDTDYIILKE